MSKTPIGWPVRELTALDRAAYAQHLLAHGPEDRRLTEAGEADAWLKLAKPDASSYFGEVFAQRVALFDFALKALRMQMQP